MKSIFTAIFITFFGLITLLTLLTSCTSHLSQEECLNLNWHHLGFDDGAQGKPIRNLQKDKKDCQRYNISINKALYFRGRKKGLKHFCTYKKGKEIGLQGNQPPEICPIDLKHNFIRGWKEGARVFCSHSSNGLEAGEKGSPYPEACPAIHYPSFKAKYDRGRAIYIRVQQLQSEVRSIDNDIDTLYRKWDFKPIGWHNHSSCHYELDKNQTKEAKQALRRITQLCQQKREIEQHIFQTKMIK